MSSPTELKLLTLLNVSAVKRPRALDRPGGHRGSPSLSASPLVPNGHHTNGNGVGHTNGHAQSADGDGSPVPKRRKSVNFGGEVGPSGSTFSGVTTSSKGKGKQRAKAIEPIAEDAERSADLNGGNLLHGLQEDADDSGDEAGPSGTSDLFNEHFGPQPSLLSAENISAAERDDWKSVPTSLTGFGKAVELRPGSASPTGDANAVQTRVTPALLSSLKATKASQLTSTSMGHLGSYRDFYLHSLEGEADGSERSLQSEQKEAVRKAAAAHALNHVLKTRRKIIRNNEKLAHSTLSDPPRDQSFTRPKVLFLLPLRSLALLYLQTHLFPLAPPGTQIENQRPFVSSFSIPADAEDPLANPKAATEFPVDHLVNFRGNSDDNFRFGIKITRKAWRVVMMPANEDKLMECDILVASPLGIKMQAEREKSEDLLSSLEIVVADGLDVMQMQNWDHVQFVFKNLNKTPEKPHGCDFSRVKEWYLEQQAKYLRQTILLSRYDTPEFRSLFHNHCHNLAGKLRLAPASFPGVLDRVKPGVKQIFERIDLDKRSSAGEDAVLDEVDQRLDWFVKKTVPALLRSAISREQTLIVVPSYFDYVQLVNYLRKNDLINFTAISEYSSKSEISRARTVFFKGKKPFLIITERLHFYRRYRIRGSRTIVYYSLPEHAQFYSEMLRTPFLGPGGVELPEGEVDEGEISSRVLFSKWDWMRLERVVGTEDARRMITSGEGRFEFV